MGERSRSFLKARFQTGAHPNESDFGDLIDSPINWEDVGTAARTLVSANTTAQARERLGITGVSGDTYLDEVGDVSATSPINGDMLVYVDGSSEWGRLATGDVGRKIIAGTATSDVHNSIGGGTIGKIISQSTTTSQFKNNIGIGDVGLNIVNTTATASLRNQLGFIPGPTIEINGDITTTKSTTLSFTPNNIDVVMEIIASSTGFTIGQTLHHFDTGVNLIGNYFDSRTFQAFVSGQVLNFISRATVNGLDTLGAAVSNSGTARAFGNGVYKLVARASRL